MYVYKCVCVYVCVYVCMGVCVCECKCASGCVGSHALRQPPTVASAYYDNCIHNVSRESLRMDGIAAGCGALSVCTCVCVCTCVWACVYASVCLCV